MPEPASSTGGGVFRIAIFAMLLSVWVYGRLSGPEEPAVEEGEEFSEVMPPAPPVVVVTNAKDEKAEPEPGTTEDAEQTGSITGFVRFMGTPPAPKLIDLNSDPYCVMFYAGKETPRDERVVVGADGALMNAFIYVSAGLPEKTWPVPAEPVVVRMIGCRYEPHVSAVRLGQRVEFLNMDETLHNVHTMAKLTPEFGEAQPRSRLRHDWMARRAEVGVFHKCDVHAFMTCYTHVMAHPFHAITGASGSFEITGLPPGEYELTVWHEMKKVQPQRNAVKVKVEAGKAAALDFTMTMQ